MMRSWESWLDVGSFDFSPFQKPLQRAKEEGVEITTLAAEREKDERWLEKIYDLHTTLAADVPSASPYTPPPLDHFRRTLLEHPISFRMRFSSPRSGRNTWGKVLCFGCPLSLGIFPTGLLVYAGSTGAKGWPWP
ncbi:MAG: hypothetical protein ACUVQS_00305 [Candidatus Bipolaricaulaceae bacterium]